MGDFTTTSLWRESLYPQADDPPQGGPRARLSETFLKFRERAAMVAGEIARDLPEFTVHDLTHLDALWEMASVIAGSQVTLTPAEAFVLGGAFLVHDMGMGLAAFPKGREELYADPSWDDLVVSALKKRLGRTPASYECRTMRKEVEIDVITELLRLRHTKHAEVLPLISWSSNDGKTAYHLIEDTELRHAFGRVIGQIAYSHWWSIDEVRQKFGGLPLLLPPAGMGCPNEWTVDRLKIACLLRMADAIHLDSRRAPGFLRALRKPSGYADLHWGFQQHINTPGIEGERITFTSGYAFTIEESSAWWVGYELLQNADRELRQVDTLLQDMESLYRFAARGVAGVESPTRLMRHIPTQDWVPVDARVQVSNVAALVQNLGGRQLYGDDYTVPLRELIQNASDAIRARRLLKGLPDTWGNVVVRLGKDKDGDWVEVQDSGIGMSTSVLVGPFLDFGKSFWDTPMMREEWPRLQATGFQSSGKYGIGFFSAFMWGDKVRVTTRRLGDAERDTQILEFTAGLGSRPILRKAHESEFIEEGTKIRVWLKESPESSRGLLSTSYIRREKWSLKDLCAWLCPCIDVNLYAEQTDGQQELCVSAGDWKTIDGRQLIKRIFLDSFPESYYDKPEEALRFFLLASNLRVLRDSSGNIIGRATVSTEATSTREVSGITVTVGGLSNGYMINMAGVLIGSSIRASRDIATPIVENDELSRWASEQAELVRTFHKKPDQQLHTANIIRNLGGDTGKLPIAYGAMGWMNYSDISNWQNLPDEILLAGIRYYSFDGLQVEGNVLVTERYRSTFFRSKSYGDEINWPASNIISVDGKQLDVNTLKVAVIEALAKAWQSTLEEVISSSSFSTGEGGAKHIVGMRGDIREEHAADVIRNPKTFNSTIV